jgi:hypothetical protein
MFGGNSTETALSLLIYFPFVKIDQRLHFFFLGWDFSDDFLFRPIVFAEPADHVGRRRRRTHVGLRLHRQAVLPHDPGTILWRPRVLVPEVPLHCNRNSRSTSKYGLRRLVTPSSADPDAPIDTGATQRLQFGEEEEILGLIKGRTSKHVPYLRRLFLAVEIEFKDDIRIRQGLSGGLGSEVKPNDIFVGGVELVSRRYRVRSHHRNPGRVGDWKAERRTTDSLPSFSVCKEFFIAV